VLSRSRTRAEPMELFWHRRDSESPTTSGSRRRRRGRATTAGTGRARIFVFDRRARPRERCAVRRLLDGLAALRDDYRDRGSDLLARGAPRPSSRTGCRASTPSASSGTGLLGGSLASATRARTALNDAGIDREVLHDAVLHTPESIRTNAGDLYSVYSYYWKKWTDCVADPPRRRPMRAIPLTPAIGFGSSGPMAAPRPTVVPIDRPRRRRRPACARRFGVQEPEGCRSRRYRGGPAIGSTTSLRCARRTTPSDHPAREATPRMSAFLKYGEIGCERRTRRRKTRDGDGGGKDRGARRGR